MVNGKCRPSANCTEPNEQRTRMTVLINDTIDDCIPYIEKVTYLKARENSPHLIEIESDPLKFLMYEKWNIWAAAQRIVKYWEWKCTVFGEERTFLPIFDISGNGCLNDTEIFYLKSGCLALLPKDSHGNCYVFINRYRLVPNIVPCLELITRLRLVFYSICLSVHEYYQGPSNDVIGDIDSDQTGTETEAASKLHQRGIPIEIIPSILGGSWSYDSFDDWFEEIYRYSKSFDIDDIQVPPDMIEERVVVSDTAHTLLNASINDSSSGLDESSDSAPLINVFGNREGSDFNTPENNFQTSNMMEIDINDKSILLPEGAMKSQIAHHYQQQAIGPLETFTVGPSCDSLDGNAESNNGFPKQLGIMSQISFNQDDLETLKSGAFMILPKNKEGQYVLSYEPVKAVSQSFESHCLCLNHCLKHIQNGSTRDSNGRIPLVMLVFLDQEFLESKLTLEHTFIDVLDSYPMIKLDFIHFFLESVGLGWYAYQDLAKCVAAQLFQYQNDKSEFHVLPSYDGEKDEIEDNIIESICYHFGFEKHNLPLRLEGTWNELPSATS